MVSVLENECTLRFDNERVPLSDLSEFGFCAPIEAGEAEVKSGVLQFGDCELPIEFRIRHTNEAGARCTFVNLPIKQQEKIRKYTKDQARIAAGNESLEERTYDELAQGITGEPETNQELTDARPKKTQLKALALTLMVIGLIGLVGLAVVFMRSRSVLSVNNSALVGNYLPINAKVEGEVEAVFVSEGQYVKKGELLLRLRNPEITSIKEEKQAAYEAAEQKVVAYRAQMENYKSMLGVAKEKLHLELEVAKSELEWSVKSEAAIQKRVERFQPYLNSGSISRSEFDEAHETLLAAEAKVIAATNHVKQIEFSQRLAKKDVLILGDRVDDEIGRIRTALEIAEANAMELKAALDGVFEQASLLEIKAPRDGQIYSMYRQPGEFLRAAEEAVALSYPGKTWAAGQVGSWQANRVCPGQPVTIRFPSMNRNLKGTVLAVGHRALYSKGGYNADFRGTSATDVPIKVLIDDLPDDIPSGIRMEMAINTGFGLNWLDNLLGYELTPIGKPPSQSIPAIVEPAEEAGVGNIALN